MENDYNKLLKRTKKVLVRLKRKLNPGVEVLINKVRFDYYGFAIMIGPQRYKVYYFPGDQTWVFRGCVFKNMADLVTIFNRYVEGKPVLYSIIEYDGVSYIDSIKPYTGVKP